MNVMADTNIILDIILKREPYFADSYAFLNLAVQDKITIMVTASSVTDVYYLLRKSGLSDPAARKALYQLLTITQLADVKPEDIHFALASDIQDFEDAVVVEVSRRNKCSAIVTRNTSDFSNSSIAIYEPKDFLTSPFPD